MAGKLCYRLCRRRNRSELMAAARNPKKHPTDRLQHAVAALAEKLGSGVGRLARAVRELGRESGAARLERLGLLWTRARAASVQGMRSLSRSRLGIAGVVAALTLAALSAVHVREIGRYYRALTAPAIPLEEGVRRSAQKKAMELAAALDRRLDKRRRFARDSWASARVLFALEDNDSAYRGKVDARRIERYFRSLAGPECACWRQHPDGKYPSHVGITAWVLRALAGYGIPAQAAELRFLLSSQAREGWWPLFSGAREKRFASSYATAAAILALHEQSSLQQDPKLKPRLAEAVRRGADWLKESAGGSARWSDYPAWPGAGEFLAVSGFVLVALHRVGSDDLEALDRDWIRRLPSEAPAAASEASVRNVRIGRRTFADRTRYHVLPWQLLATASAYAGASLSGKVRAIEWIERSLAPGAPIHALTGRERDIAAAAEAMLALGISARGAP